MGEPLTEAGRVFLSDVRASALPGSLSHDANREYVRRIENEVVTIIREHIEALQWWPGTGTMFVGERYIDRAAALRLLDELTDR